MPLQAQTSPRRIALPAVVAALAFGTAACGATRSADASAQSPVSISVTVSNATEPYVIPWLVAQQQGFFRARGVLVKKILPSKGGSTTVRNMLSGDLPIAEAGFTSVIQSQNAGAPVTVFGGATRSVYGLDFYTLSTNKSINSIDDIKTWAYTNEGSVTQALTYMLPKAAGVSAKAKRVAAGGIGEGIALLESGDVDAAIVPPSVIAKDPGKFREVVPSADYIHSFQQSVLTTTPQYAKTHPGVLKAVTGGYQDAVEWIQEHPVAAGKVYARYASVDPSVGARIVKAAVKADNWSVGFDAAAITTAIEAMKVGGTDVGSSYCTMFDDSYLPKGASHKLPADCQG